MSSSDASQRLPPLSAEARRIFAAKGENNAVKLRRITQLVEDLTKGGLSGARVLDLGCGEGVYAIELGLRGASVLAIDGRVERLQEGEALARQLGLTDVRFLQADVRSLAPEAVGEFDVVLCLGLLYHLEAQDAVRLLATVGAVCTGLLVIDTHVSLAGRVSVTHDGAVYRGKRYREHRESEGPDERRAKLASSLDNAFSFCFTTESLMQLLARVGFTSVYECHVPFEPERAVDRRTFVACKGAKRTIWAYPWINDLPEADVAARMRQLGPWQNPWPGSGGDLRERAKRLFKRGLLKLGIEIRRV